jgi:hypothetical protein
MCAFYFVATYKPVFDQSSFYRFHCREPHRIHRANETHHGHQQRRNVQIFCALRLHKRLQPVVPEVCEDVIPNFVSRPLPHIERAGKRAFLGKSQSAIDRDPAH